MSLLLRAFLIIISALFFVFVCFMVRREKLLLQYSIMWLFLSALGMVLALFPSTIIQLSSTLGFESPANLVFVAVIAVLLAVCLMYSRALTNQALMIKDLVQELSMLKSELGEVDSDTAVPPNKRIHDSYENR